MNWSDVIRRAESIAKEKNTPQGWADLVNEALEKMDPHSHVVDAVEVALTAGQTEYELPSDLRRVSRVLLAQNGTERRLRQLTWGDIFNQGYRLPPGKIQLVGIEPQTGQKLLLVGPLRLPRVTVEDMDLATSTEITMIPDEWQWLLESYCVWRMQEREWGAEEARSEKALWLQGLADYASAQFRSQATGRIERRAYY